MKIIALTTSGFLCEISGRELSLLGVHKPSIGTEVQLERAFDTLSSLKNVSTSDLKKVGYQITQLQDRFKEIEETYDKVMLLSNIRDSK
jgi:hypothetical protein